MLLVADMFKFTECGIRKLAIEQLEKTATCVQKIIWGGKYRIKSLLEQGYREACNRDETFTVQELIQLQRELQSIGLIMKIREAKLFVSGPKTRALVSEEE